MISLEAIKAVPRQGKDWNEAEKIKSDLEKLKKHRQPFFLDPVDLAPVMRYKLREQERRSTKHRERWTTEFVAAVTRAAFSIRLENRETEAAVRVGILSVLPGVGIPVASAILALTEPEKYAIVDFRVWRQLFGTEKRSFASTDYIVYMRRIWQLAEELRWPPQIVDWCIWRQGHVDEGDPGTR